MEDIEKPTRRGSNSSGSLYETPLTEAVLKTNYDLEEPKEYDMATVRDTLPSHGGKRSLFEVEPGDKKSDLNLPPRMVGINHKDGADGGKFLRLLRRKGDQPNSEIHDAAPDKTNEQIPVEVIVVGTDKRSSEKFSDLQRVSLKSIFGIGKFGAGKNSSSKEPSEIQFPQKMPPRGLWGPKSRHFKALSVPEFASDEEKTVKGGILWPSWKKSKKRRPVSFAPEPITHILRSDTESADHGSTYKSSVSKLTEEKQNKTFLGQLLDSLKVKNKDKVVDNEALKNFPMTIDKDLEQHLQNDHLQKDYLKADGIVYAELDMARAHGNVVRRDDEKTEYAEIIHPKAAEFKMIRDDLKRSRENLSGSREHLTENESTTVVTPDGKKEAAV